MPFTHEDFAAGMTWGWVGVHGQWATPEAAASMRAMTETGVNWVAIAFQGVQKHAQDTTIRYHADSTVRDDEVLWAIQEAKSSKWSPNIGFAIIIMRSGGKVKGATASSSPHFDPIE